MASWDIFNMFIYDMHPRILAPGKHCIILITGNNKIYLM
jgi:hypothetical protein